jgi:hypothetical protein
VCHGELGRHFEERNRTVYRDMRTRPVPVRGGPNVLRALPIGILPLVGSPSVPDIARARGHSGECFWPLSCHPHLSLDLKNEGKAAGFGHAC